MCLSPIPRTYDVMLSAERDRANSCLMQIKASGENDMSSIARRIRPSGTIACSLSSSFTASLRVAVSYAMHAANLSPDFEYTLIIEMVVSVTL